MVVGLLGGFKEEDIFWVRWGVKRVKLLGVLLQRRDLKGDTCGCNDEKRECVPPCECGEAAIWSHS